MTGNKFFFLITWKSYDDRNIPKLATYWRYIFKNIQKYFQKVDTKNFIELDAKNIVDHLGRRHCGKETFVSDILNIANKIFATVCLFLLYQKNVCLFNVLPIMKNEPCFAP